MNNLPGGRPRPFKCDALTGLALGVLVFFASGSSLAADPSQWKINWEVGNARGQLTVTFPPNTGPRLEGTCVKQNSYGDFHGVGCDKVFDVRASTSGDKLNFEYSVSPARCRSHFDDTYAFHLKRTIPQYCTGFLCYSVFLWKSWARVGHHCLGAARHSETVGFSEVDLSSQLGQ